MKHILFHVYDTAIVGLYTNDSAMFSYFPISVGKICNCQAWVGVHSDTVETAVDPV